MTEAQDQKETLTWPLEKLRKPFGKLHPEAFAMERESTASFETSDNNAQILYKLEKIPPEVTLAFQYRKNENLYRTFAVEIKRQERTPYLIYAQLPDRKFEGIINPVEDNTILVTQWSEINLGAGKLSPRYKTQDQPLILTNEEAKSLTVEIIPKKIPLEFAKQQHG